MRWLMLIIFAVLFPAAIIGCDFGEPSHVEPLAELGPRRELSLQDDMYIANGRLEATGKYWGSSIRLRVLDGTDEPKRWLTNHEGLWLASENNTIEANHFGRVSFGLQFAPIQNDSSGYFVITRDSLDIPISNWPTHLGAPSDAFGQPQLYGDVMGWSLFQPDTTSLHVMKGIAIGITTYLFEEQALSGFAFRRHDIINTGDEPISNFFIGYGADMDIHGAVVGPECESLTHWENQMGLDLERFLHYVYLSPHPEDGALPDRCYGSVTAFSVLPMSTNEGIGANKLASRMWRRASHSSIYPDFWETLDSTPEAILNALKGLSAAGEPMMNPVTGQATKFAFTGDPIAGTGWIDERNDGRQLVSMEPITLLPGEHKSITTVWLYADKPTLAEALSSIKSQHDYIMTRSEVWDY